jgi:hypothetical protein
MAGLKTFWITISTLFFLAACVPQTKQTECRSNEAFNAALRSCVPVVQGPAAFISIDTYSPVYPLSLFKDDFTVIPLSITVSNPYNQSFTIEWERVYNGVPSFFAGNVFTTSLVPVTLAQELGNHFITAKVRSGGVVVDSHTFQVNISDLPKPSIQTTTVVPAIYAPVWSPLDTAKEFSFRVNNNGADMSAGYFVRWQIYKNGVEQTALEEFDSFTNVTPTGFNMIYYGSALLPRFNPALLGIGNYIIRATVVNTIPGQTVAEQQWGVTIRHPDLGQVTTIGSPAPGVNLTSYNNLNYTQFPFYNFVTTPGAAQGTFCVALNQPRGAYAGDGQGLLVKYYLNGTGGDICTKETNDAASSQTVCLVDSTPCVGGSTPFDTALLNFSNTSASVTQNHKITARVFDKFTGIEYQRDNVLPSNGSYPIEWLVLVKPINDAPKLGFGTTQPTGCTDAGFARNNCQVNQGTDFNITFTIDDDFYHPTVHPTKINDPEKFLINARVKYNGADLAGTNTACTKSFGSPTGSANLSTYTTQYTCTMRVPHFTSSGPLNPSVGSYSVVLNVQDQDSPVSPSNPQSAIPLTWNLAVTETNPSNIALAAQSILAASSHVAVGSTVLDPNDVSSFAQETQTVTFRLLVTDNELDNFKYKVSLCTVGGSACTGTVALTNPAFIDFLRAIQSIPDENPTLVTGLQYTLPENLLLQVSPVLDVGTAIGDVQKVYFKVEVIDVPSVPTTSVLSTPPFQIYEFYVRNYNPAPVINTAGAVPAVGSTTVVYSGYPITINPGSVTDASAVGSGENIIQYQWYSRLASGGPWTAIAGATFQNLVYTPGNTSSDIEIKLCVGDRPAANPIDPAGPNCSGLWTISPRQTVITLNAQGLTNVEDSVASWFDNTNTFPDTQVFYSAWAGDDKRIYVEKTVKNAAGNIVTSTTVRFNALPAGSTSTISNLSLTGTTTSLYIAYLASNASTPSSMVPRIRRIDKDFTNQSKTSLGHPGPFGFNYASYSMSGSCSTCTFANSDGAGSAATISFSGPVPDGETITLTFPTSPYSPNSATFTAATPATAADEFCSSATCSTGDSTATSLASKINGSSLAILHGITARANGPIVELFGNYNNDFLDFDGSILISGSFQVPSLISNTNGMGRIFIDGGRWYIPLINSSLGGGQQNNVTMISGPSDVHLRSSAALITDDVLTEMGRTALFDAKLATNGELIFARISGALADAGAIRLFRYQRSGSDWSIVVPPGSPNPAQAQLGAFSGLNFEDVKLAADAASNPNFYVIAKERQIDGGEYHLGKYSTNLAAVSAYERPLMTQLVTTDSTSTVVSDTLLKNPDIFSIPGFQEARLVFHSVGSGVTPFARMARIRNDMTVSCGSCSPLISNDYQSTAVLGVSHVANNITLGQSGNTANENTKDLVLVMMSTSDGVNFKPQLGIINIEAEAIQSTSIQSPEGLFRPPFVKD